MTEEEKYEREQELEEEKHEALETWAGILRKNKELRSYAETSTSYTL